MAVTKGDPVTAADYEAYIATKSFQKVADVYVPKTSYFNGDTESVTGYFWNRATGPITDFWKIQKFSVDNFNISGTLYRVTWDGAGSEVLTELTTNIEEGYLKWQIDFAFTGVIALITGNVLGATLSVKPWQNSIGLNSTVFGPTGVSSFNQPVEFSEFGDIRFEILSATSDVTVRVQKDGQDVFNEVLSNGDVTQFGPYEGTGTFDIILSSASNFSADIDFQDMKRIKRYLSDLSDFDTPQESGNGGIDVTLARDGLLGAEISTGGPPGGVYEG